MEPLQKRNTYPGTGNFIKAHLQSVGEDYPYNIYKALCESLEGIGQRSPLYQSFRTYWNILANLQLVEFVRTEPSGTIWPRRYYRMNPNKVNSSAWRNPRAALDIREGHTIPDPATGKPVPVSRLGRRRYNRRVLKKPPLPSGGQKKRKGVS